jgi:hypothetical protein
MAFKKYFENGVQVITLDDGVLIRRFHIFSDNYIQEKVALKKKRGRPEDLCYWYHKDMGAMRMSAVLERYELNEDIGEGNDDKNIRRL